MSRFNSEFNYRTQVIGETPWAKIQTIKGFLAGRLRAEKLEAIEDIKHKALVSELQFLKDNNSPEHIILNKLIEIMTIASSIEESRVYFQENRDEIAFLKSYLDELYAIVETTRINGASDDEMIELNAENEFTLSILKEMQAEKIAYGHAMPATIRNAMRTAHTWESAKALGFVPSGAQTLVLLPPADEKTLLPCQ